MTTNRRTDNHTPAPVQASPPLRYALALCALLSAPVIGDTQRQSPLLNGGFEDVQTVKPGADGTYSRWTFAGTPLLPRHWSLNTAYPGRLTVADGNARTGERCVRIEGAGGSAAHLYQMCSGLEADTWYRVEAWYRGGPLAIQVYEYFEGGKIQGRVLAQGVAKTGDWQVLQGFYRPVGEGYLRSALALTTPPGKTVEVDDMSLTVPNIPRADPGLPPTVFENDLLRLAIGSDARLRGFTCKATGRDYAAHELPFPVMTVQRGGMTLTAAAATREGDILTFRFLDTEVVVRARVTARKQHFLLEIIAAAPADVDRVDLDFPVKRLTTVAWAFNGTYDEDFGACLFGTTVNVCNRPAARGGSAQSLRSSCYRNHGIVGAKFALIGAPRGQFKAAIMEAEQQNGLPCPILDGEWAYDSDAARRSYLFATNVNESSIDTLIDYARIGGFGTIMILKGSWLANHGHFDVNTGSFPDGREGLKRAVAKIHDAGLHAGVHVFGPSISPNDPYVTPVPDDRLAAVPCPPLAQAVDAQAKTLTLAEQPERLPPKAARSRAFPGYCLRLGDELITYADVTIGPPFQFVGCTRGALGTVAAEHAAGTEVKGLLRQWGFFLVDPDSTLADELTTNFADVFNTCDFDMAYFDASDGGLPQYQDTWYYLNQLHLGFYSKLKKDVIYQTSNGTGSNILWHIVPRSASADGHGDIKGYLDQRWPGILNMASNFTKPDVGWYYWFKECRPDQIEYVCAKALGVDGTISLETSREAMDRLAQTRQMFEMIAKYEACRRADVFGAQIRALLREPKKDFKLFQNRQGEWSLFRAAYESPRPVDLLDGEQNVWQIRNESAQPVQLGVELVRTFRDVTAAEYDSPGARLIEPFDNAVEYRHSEANPYEKFVIGGSKEVSENGAVRGGVTQSFEHSTAAKAGAGCMVYRAANSGEEGGWGGIGRRFVPPLDLDNGRAVGLWVYGDAKGEHLRIQFRDVAGEYADWLPAINFEGWRLLTFRLPRDQGFDWRQTEFLLFYFNGIPANTAVQVLLDDVRIMPSLRPQPAAVRPVLVLNDTRFELPAALESRQALTIEGRDGVRVWPGGMQPARNIAFDVSPLILRPGANTVRFETTPKADYPGDITVLLYRMWPLAP